MCNFDLTDFPRDKQWCYMNFLSWTYDITQVNLTQNPLFPVLIRGPWRKNPEWEVLQKQIFPNTLNYSMAGQWPVIGIRFQLQRRDAMYFYKLGLPYLCASLMGIASFLVPAGGSQRYFFACSSIVILFLLMVQLGFDLGPHSIMTPYAVKCIGINMIVMIVALVVSTILRRIVEQLSDSCPPLPRYLIDVLDGNWVPMIFCLHAERGPTRNLRSAVESASDDNPFKNAGQSVATKEWQLLAQLLDRICFIIYIGTTIIYHS